jgi:small-conductance mechanosensitive channel
VNIVFYEAVAYAAVVLHFAFLALGILGGFAAWRWPWLVWLQIAAASWLVLVVAAGLPCPLTWVEDQARVHGGLPAHVGGFLDNHVAGVFYPHGHERIAQIVAALIVLSSWAGLLVVRRRRRRAGSPSRSRRSSPDRAAQG